MLDKDDAAGTLNADGRVQRRSARKGGVVVIADDQPRPLPAPRANDTVAAKPAATASKDA